MIGFLADLSDTQKHPSAADVAEILRQHAAMCMPFVRIGTHTLIVTSVPQLLVFDEQLSARYSIAALSAAVEGRLSSTDLVPPHLYGLVTSAFIHMMAKQTDQSIVFIGNAFSGAALCAKMIAKHLCSLSLNATKKSRVISGVQKMETILDAFGSSSSANRAVQMQFGRYTEYQYDERGKMVGVKLLDYLFDKDRVAYVPKHERNFSVFYYLLAGASEQERSQWRINDTSSFAYLKGAGRMTIGPTASALRESFDELRQHFKSLG
eukprot:jgi/Hompol1/6693/HPOL_000413-RA